MISQLFFTQLLQPGVLSLDGNATLAKGLALLVRANDNVIHACQALKLLVGKIQTHSGNVAPTPGKGNENFHGGIPA